MCKEPEIPCGSVHWLDTLAQDLGKVVGNILLALALLSMASDQTGATKLASLRAAIRQNKRSISALTQMASVAETCSSARKATWPFVVRGALVLWVMTSDEDLALAFLREWPQNQRAAAPWTAERLRQEISSLTEKAKDLLLKPASKLGERALSSATKYLKESFV